jgi:hypothetical protein
VEWNSLAADAGPNDAVSMRGLTIEGAGVGLAGIVLNSGRSLTIANCVIRHFTFDGISFLPTASSNLSVSNTLVAHNGNDGIRVLPSGSGAVTAVLNRVEMNNNTFGGIEVNGATSTGTVAATMSGSVAARNGTVGFHASSSIGQAPTTLMVFRSVAANNGIGILSDGAGATLRVPIDGDRERKRLVSERRQRPAELRRQLHRRQRGGAAQHSQEIAPAVSKSRRAAVASPS